MSESLRQTFPGITAKYPYEVGEGLGEEFGEISCRNFYRVFVRLLASEMRE